LSHKTHHQKHIINKQSNLRSRLTTESSTEHHSKLTCNKREQHFIHRTNKDWLLI